jgi:hypothetical protein
MTVYERAQEEDEEEKTVLTSRDIKDLNFALKLVRKYVSALRERGIGH